MLGEARMRHMKLPLANGEFPLRGEVDWIRTCLSGVWRLEVLVQGLGLRQVLQLEWVTVGRKSNVFVFEAHL